LSDGADIRRDSEESVDDVDDTAVECNVLTIVSLHRLSVGWNDLQLQSRSRYLVVYHAALDNLATSDIGIGSVVEESGREGGSLSDV
jgi:hypothetical protein